MMQEPQYRRVYVWMKKPAGSGTMPGLSQLSMDWAPSFVSKQHCKSKVHWVENWQELTLGP
jgi:hypothetical protein